LRANIDLIAFRNPTVIYDNFAAKWAYTYMIH